MSIKYNSLDVLPKILLLLIALLPHLPALAQTHNAVFWRGFSHSWSYNHRINRIGNYVEMEDKQPVAYHASASGLGSDSTWFNTFYTKVYSPNLFFKEYQYEIKSEGNEGDLLTKVTEVNIALDDSMIRKQNFKIFINGFEIKSITKADQLNMLRFMVEDPKVMRENKSISAKVHLNLVTNCRTIECEIFDNRTAYSLNLHLLVVAYNDGEAQSFESYHSKSYVWDEAIEVPETADDMLIQGIDGKYEQAIVGIKAIGIILDQEHWLKDLDYHILPNNYNSKTGKLAISLKMMYRVWQNGMQLFATAPKKASFAERRPGYALLDISPILLQTNNASVEHGEIGGSMFWKGWNADASGDAALKKVPIPPFVAR